MKDIFSLDDLEDLPWTLRGQIGHLDINKDAKNVLNMFWLGESKDTLSVDEILVCLFRTFRTEKTRKWVLRTLYLLAKKGEIEKISPGVYRRLNKLPRHQLEFLN